MSRIGKQPIVLPNGVTAEVLSARVRIAGPKGEQTIAAHPLVRVQERGGVLTVSPRSSSRQARMMWGTTRALLAGAVQGTVDGYRKVLELHGVGYRAALQGKNLSLSLGFSHPVVVEPPEGVTFSVDGTVVTVEGIDKQRVGETAAAIRAKRPPEPYKGKGIRYRNEVVRRKAGKKAAGAAG